MKKSFSTLLKQFKTIVLVFDEDSCSQKSNLLKLISQSEWKNATQLIDYHELLLFLASHPSSNQITRIVENELNRIARYLKNCSTAEISKYNDSGLPYTNLITRYSHDLLQFILHDHSIKMSFDSFDELGVDLNTLLKFTLPALEKDETTAGLENDELMNALGISKKNYIQFLISEFSKLNDQPAIKDYLWESMKIFIHIESRSKLFSRSYNRIEIESVFYQDQLLKKFDSQKVIETSLPNPIQLSQAQLEHVATVIRHSLTLTLRETDPSTYMDLSTLRLFQLDRGITIAIYGMNEYRQLPLQSYIGYTLFKNGFPAAYGGSWIFGERAMFGLNIFEAFRGGESGYMMCQLLRVYKQVFKLTYIEVEPYQYGLDNPDGIQSGAFWFYYRYGFRPVDSTLFQLAQREQIKIKNKQGYRSKENILLEFTISNIALQFEKKIPPDLGKVKSEVTKMIAYLFNGDRVEALKHCKNELLGHFTAKNYFTKSETLVMEDIALLVKISTKKSVLNMPFIKKIIKIKPICPYQYNALLTKFLSD